MNGGAKYIIVLQPNITYVLLGRGNYYTDGSGLQFSETRMRNRLSN